METQRGISVLSQFLVLLLLLLLSMVVTTTGFGSMGSISGAYGEEDGFFCAIDASGKQEIICWKKNSSTSSTAAYFTSLPPMAALTGGAGFMCGLLSNTSQAYCWNSIDSGKSLVPQLFRFNAYSHIAAGLNHVCGVRGFYFSSTEASLGTVDCWEIFIRTSNSSSEYKSSLFDTSVILRTIVAGDGFSCGGGMREGGIVCWGPKSKNLGVSGVNDKIVKLASSRDSICGILEDSGEVKCWGTNKIDDLSSDPPVGTRFVALAAGLHHYCGIREDDHGIECWGNYNKSSVAKGGFLAISSSDFITCGVREDNLILYCWSTQGPLPLDYKPPLQLCSPGVCMSDSCVEGEFSFNASILGVPGLANLCVKTELNMCLPCGLNCADGFFPSSVCDKNVDLVCTACSFCQNSSCWDVCGPPPSSSLSSQQQHQMKKLVIIIVCSVSGLTLFIIVWCLLPNKSTAREEEIQRKNQCSSCIGPSEVEVEMDPNPETPLFLVPSISKTQVFRLSELKDATNGFKEFNELGRGRYGFVYKAILSDGLQVAVKRANAATIIHSNSRDFEAELEVLCKVRHCNIVNLLGYCAEMGERLLVYEFMPHGTLHDHLHDHLSPLTWNLRLKISLQSARGLEYLHKDAVPPIIHRDIKTSNILLDSEWVARIADFGLVNNERDLNGDEKSDVYSFGIVLLEILSGRKAYDNEYTPPDIVEWALPYIRQGKAAAIIDRSTPFPRNMEPLLKLAEIAERAVRKDPSERPIMSHVVLWLEQIVKGGLIS